MSQAASASDLSGGNQTNNSSIGFTGQQMLWAIVAVAGAVALYFLLKGRN